MKPIHTFTVVPALPDRLQRLRDLAYNIVTHSGPGAGLYLEFLPYTQEQGGLERLGLHVCQATPGQAAARLRAALQAWPGRSFRKD